MINGTSKILVMSTSKVLREGITTWMMQIFSHMDQNGFDLHTVAWESCDSALLEEIKCVGFTVHVLPDRKNSFRQYLASFRKLVKNGNFDIVHVSGSSALTSVELAIAKSAGVKTRIVHSRNTTCDHKLVDGLLRPAMLSCSTDLFACGTDAGRWLFGNRDFTVIPNGKDLDVFEYRDNVREKIRQLLGLRDGQTALGHVGFFNRNKNHQYLIDVFAAYLEMDDSAMLFLIGDGALKVDIERIVEEKGLSGAVVFLGQRSDVPDLLNAMDCMIFPSINEGFPNVVLEWQANGLPCVISDSITQECAITSLVTFRSLDDGARTWAHSIFTALASSSRRYDSQTARVSMSKAGYDIFDAAALLRGLYLEKAFENGGFDGGEVRGDLK